MIFRENKLKIDHDTHSFMKRDIIDLNRWWTNIDNDIHTVQSEQIQKKTILIRDIFEQIIALRINKAFNRFDDFFYF